VPLSSTTGRACVCHAPENAVAIDVDTFLVTVYCLIDDLYREHVAPARAHRPGRPGELSDSEVLTLAVLCQWQPYGSERQFIRWAAVHWRQYFPHLISQSAFNRRARQLYGVLANLAEWIRHRIEPELDAAPVYEVIDGVPVPLMRRARGTHHRCFGVEADIGLGGCDKDWYYGVKVLAAVDNLGFLTGWVVGPASTEEHWLAEALFSWRQQPTAPAPTAAGVAAVLGPSHHRPGGARRGPRGPVRGRWSAGHVFDGPSLSDLGLQGTAWRRHWRDDLGATVLLKSDYLPGPDQDQSKRWFCRRRLQIENTFSTLEARFHLKFPRARTFWGLLTRLAAKVTAYNIALAVNCLLGHISFAFFNPLA
jgi:hypothetical protein